MNRKLFVGNLSFNTEEDALQGLFAQAGQVESVRVMRDQATGRSRGFAFVEMAEVEAKPAIAALDGRIVDGQTIQVREGRAKLHRAASKSDSQQHAV